MIKVKITAKTRHYSPGQVVEMNEFDAGHAFAFHYGVPHVERKIRKAVVEPPEIRGEPEEKPTEINNTPVKDTKHQERKPKRKWRRRTTADKG